MENVNTMTQLAANLKRSLCQTAQPDVLTLKEGRQVSPRSSITLSYDVTESLRLTAACPGFRQRWMDAKSRERSRPEEYPVRVLFAGVHRSNSYVVFYSISKPPSTVTECPLPSRRTNTFLGQRGKKAGLWDQHALASPRQLSNDLTDFHKTWYGRYSTKSHNNAEITYTQQ
jgi:hypothetical protein